MKRFLFPLFFIGAHFVAAAPVEESIETIRAVSSEGEGNAAAAEAWSALSEAESAAIPVILEAFDGANAIAANWLRAAVEVIADREKELPIEALKDFLAETSHDGAARVLALDLIRGADEAAAEALVPGLLNDPAAALRRGAVQRLLDEAKALADEKKKEEAVARYRDALDAARDIDQIEGATKALREAGEKVDVPRLFGFLMHWKVLGPFDNTERRGFGTVFPPEEEIDLSATYEGVEGEVAWVELVTGDEYGMVDFNKPYGLLKEVTGYAYTEFESEEEREVEFRLGCKNGWKLWVNGELLFGRDEYHRGMRIDQYRIPAKLKKGKNTILVKACQDHQTQEWTVEWQFQLRVTDATGTAVLAVNRPPTPVAEKKVDKRRG